MLTQLHIKNFAIIDQLELDLASGMTSMTGETGAGKSILLDALGLVLGDRSDNSSVRHGASKADINATFDISSLPELQAWLEEQDLEAERECILRRVVTQEGRSKGYINGSPVNLGVLKQVGEQLVDIHGQHAHQSLLKKDIQRQRLDDYGQHSELLETVKQAWKTYRKAQKQYDELASSEQQRNERQDLLTFQVNELEQLSLQAGEWNEIDEEYKRLANASSLLSTSQKALYTLYENDDNTVHSILGQQVNALEELSSLDPRLAPIASSLNTALVHIDEASAELRDYTSALEMDPARLTYLEERMGAIHTLSRKHQCDPEELVSLYASLSEELSQLTSADATLEAMQETLKQHYQSFITAAHALSEQRKQTASTLSEQVTQAMQGLGMEGGRFAIDVVLEEDKPAPHGLDKIEFMVSANPGQPAKALSKVASGGELSRISLAIQMITASCEKVPTLIFDEVDTGIGGGIAEIVGRHLRELGGSRQIMCVTHLPQVAAQAHNHLKIAKQKGENHTTTQVYPLAPRDRTEEIARMLGGVEITRQTLDHAQEMIDRAATV